MAEFVEVMKMARRICNNMKDCEDCPIYSDHDECCKFNEMAYFSDYDLSIFEEVIMEWDANYPEPRYPTWEELQRQTFPDAPRFILPCTFMGVIDGYCSRHNCHECAEHHIPADIAKKLGVKPIAKENSG